jgi:hypothetical protein
VAENAGGCYRRNSKNGLPLQFSKSHGGPTTVFANQPVARMRADDKLREPIHFTAQE